MPVCITMGKHSGSRPAFAGPRNAGRKSRDSGLHVSATKEFMSYFHAIYGPRWDALHHVLVQPTRHVAMANSFCGHKQPPVEDSTFLFGNEHITCYSFQADSGSYPPPLRDDSCGLLPYYWLDFASVLPPLLLGVHPGQQVLDMCAAPGGKSLVLAMMLFSEPSVPHASPGTQTISARPMGTANQSGTCSEAAMEPDTNRTNAEATLSNGRCSGATAQHDIPASPRVSGRLVCNEIDGHRRGRLHSVLNSYIPSHIMDHIRITPHDAAIFWQRCEQGSYDAVLVDAPCSSDRHRVQQAAAKHRDIWRADWSPARCKRYAAQQLKLLIAGMKALKPGGRLVYSTCSIAVVQNDQVVQKLLRKCPEAALVQSMGGGGQGGLSEQHLADLGAQKTEYGWLLLPDTNGWGPIYLSMLQKAKGEGA